MKESTDLLLLFVPKQWMPLQKECIPPSLAVTDMEATIWLLAEFPQALQSMYLFSYPESAKCHIDSWTRALSFVSKRIY